MAKKKINKGKTNVPPSPSSSVTTSSSSSSLESNEIPATYEYCPCHACNVAEAEAAARVKPLDMLNIDTLPRASRRVKREAKATAFKSYSTDQKPISSAFKAKLEKCKTEILTTENWKAYRDMWVAPFEEGNEKIDKVDKIVCLALGGFYEKSSEGSLEFEHWFYELACVFAVEELVRKKQGSAEPLPIYFQEPSFLKADVRILTALGASVVWHPQASDIIDSNTFVFANCMTWSSAYDVIYHSDLGVYFGTAAENMMIPRSGYEARTWRHFCEKEPDNVKEIMFTWLKQRKVLRGTGVELDVGTSTDDPKNVPSRRETRSFLSSEYIYWKPSSVEADVQNKEYRTEAELTETCDNLVTENIEEYIDHYDAERLAASRSKMSEHEREVVRAEFHGRNRAFDLDQWVDSMPGVSNAVRSKFETVKTEIKTGAAWTDYRSLLESSLDAVLSSGGRIDAVVLLGSETFYDAAEYGGQRGFELWFYNLALMSAIVEMATEKMKTDVSFIIEHVIGQSGEDTFPQSKSMLAGLGATLIKRSDVGYAIGPRTLVFKSHHDGNIAEKAEVILSFAPAILISQRIEYLLDEEVSKLVTTISTKPDSNKLFNAKEQALKFLKTHHSAPVPEFSREYVAEKGIKDEDEEEAGGIFPEDMAIYWPGKGIDVDMEELVKKYSLAMLMADESSSEDSDSGE